MDLRRRRSVHCLRNRRRTVTRTPGTRVSQERRIRMLIRRRIPRERLKIASPGQICESSTSCRSVANSETSIERLGARGFDISTGQIRRASHGVLLALLRGVRTGADRGARTWGLWLSWLDGAWFAIVGDVDVGVLAGGSQFALEVAGPCAIAAGVREADAAVCGVADVEAAFE